MREPAIRDLVQPDFFRQGILQHASQPGAGETAKEGDEDADRPITRRLDILDFHSKGIARLRAFDVDRSGLGIEIGAEDLRGLVICFSDLALERVVGVDGDRLARFDRGDGIDVAAEDVVVRTLLPDLPHDDPPPWQWRTADPRADRSLLSQEL